VKLLSVSSDAKTVKGEKQGYLTGILYLSPSDSSGVLNACAFASPGCRAACLNTAGRAAIFPAILDARRRKTELFHSNRAQFFRLLVDDIAALKRKAAREGLTPVVRLNGTSDIPWEIMPVTVENVVGMPLGNVPNIFTLFSDVQFYDYTKNPFRVSRTYAKRLPSNYDLTFSRSETNDSDVRIVLENGGRVAVVFSTKKGRELPSMYLGKTVIDGDVSDLRFLDAPGVVVGLRAKGKAKGEASGFTVDVH
jgi:hypothetical protein